MVKGYHYTEPTNPSRTDSARLYLDTSINGEESSVVSGDYNWIKYEISGSISEDSTIFFNGFLPANFWTSTIPVYIRNLDGSAAITTIHFVVYSDPAFTNLNVDSGVVSSNPRTWYDISITGPGTYSYNDPNSGVKYNFTLTEVDFGNKWVVPGTAYIDSNISTLCHLKGFHNFYVKN